jgi:hypothetical protein
MFFPPQEIEGPIAGYSHEPGGGVIGKAVNRLYFQSPTKSVLDYVLGQIEAAQSKNPG